MFVGKATALDLLVCGFCVWKVVLDLMVCLEDYEFSIITFLVFNFNL